MDKREQWDFIQKQEPSLAKLLLEINKVFGKPESFTLGELK